ncbi:MAG TPA: hypothetical protein DCE42_24465 [Myxococcales bacterium]|nr:hypothetical protein [Deltaproteobacteria bacterium]MBU54064.1 hypothetical protein [Deltaproteobacteria bacterium]HAA57941.1 hypothetical protein [Myxococcales bacterium]
MRPLLQSNERQSQQHTRSSSPLYVRLHRWIEEYVSQRTGDCFEVGGGAGERLSIFGSLGYRLNGVDTTSAFLMDTVNALRSQGYQLGDFFRGELSQVQTYRRYDLVASFGQLGAKDDWEEKLEAHLSLLGSEGTLILTTRLPGEGVELAEPGDADFRQRRRQLARWHRALEGGGFAIAFAGSVPTLTGLSFETQPVFGLIAKRR